LSSWQGHYINKCRGAEGSPLTNFIFSAAKTQAFKPGDLSSVTSAKEDEAQEKKPSRVFPIIPRAEARGGLF